MSKVFNSSIFQVLFLFVIYRIIHSLFGFITHNLNHDVYKNSDSFFIAAFSDIKFVVFFFGIFVFLLLNYKKLSWDSWEGWGNKNVLRVFILIVAFPLFWEHGFTDYNYYLDTDNNLDRVLIFLALVMIYIHPLFAFVYLTIGMVIWNFINFPMPGSHWIDARPPYEILMLFVAFLLIKSINKFKDINTNIFILLALTMHASNYFIPGVAKIEISPHGWEWALLDDATNLFVTSYTNGWLGFLDEKTVLTIAHYLDKIDFMLTIPSLLMQVLAIFLLVNKRVTITLFLFFEVLHFGVIFAGGIVFWAWIIVNIGFVYLIKNMSKENLNFLYHKKIVLLFMAIVALSPILYKPPVLAWWDAPIHMTYDIHITTEDNQTRKLNSLDLSPYNTVFVQNNFAYLSEDLAFHPYNYGFIIRDLHEYSNISLLLSNLRCDGCLQKQVDSFDNDSYTLYKALGEVENEDDLKVLIAKHGKSFYNEEKREQLREFLQTYFTNFNKRGKGEAFYKKFGAPYHQYDVSSKRLLGDEKVIKIELTKMFVWYNKKKREITYHDKKSIMTIEIK